MRHEVDTCKQPHALEKASDQATTGFNLGSDWLRGWHELSRPITGLSEAKPMQSRIIQPDNENIT